MSIQSEITRISGNISDSLAAVEDMGGTVPSGATSNNLAAAIRTIAGSGGIYVGDDAPTDDKYLMWVDPDDESTAVLPIAEGGTGASTAEGARTALGAASQAEVSSLRLRYIDSERFNVTIGASGYVAIPDNYKAATLLPSNATRLFAVVQTWSTATGAFFIDANGIYIGGTANANITGLSIRYFYTVSG